MKGLAVLGAILLALIGSGASPAQAAAVKAGHIGTMADGPIYIAMDKGYFKEAGLELSLERFATGGAMMAPLSTGALHIAGGAISVGFFNALARGFPVKIVAPRNRNIAGFSADSIAVRADLKEQIRRPSDLKGKKVAHPGAGSATIYMMGKYLEREGLTLKDVEIVYMPFPDMRAAFSRKAIDAMVGPDPFPTVYQGEGLAVILTRVAEFLKPDIEVSSVFYYSDWAEKNSQAAKDFMVAYLKGVREYHEAANRGRNRAEVMDTLVKYTAIKDRALFDKMEWMFIDPNGQVSKESIKDQQDWYVKNGLVPKKVDVDAVVDESYVKYALEKLGRYRPR